MLVIQCLSYRYNENTTIRYADWEAKAGSHALILGNSGSGKTTLLHLIGALLRPTEGKVTIDGKDMTEMKPSGRDRYRGRHIGIIFQKAHLIRSLSVKENLLLAQYLAGEKTDPVSTEHAMRQLDILNLKDRKIHEISHGQAQRVSIARAVLNGPKLLLADEPTSSLDDENCQKVIALLKELAIQKEASLIIATHDQRLRNEFENKFSL